MVQYVTICDKAFNGNKKLLAVLVFNCGFGETAKVEFYSRLHCKQHSSVAS